MSRKTKRNQNADQPLQPAHQSPSASGRGTRNVVIGAIAVLPLAAGAWALLHKGEDSQSSGAAGTPRGKRPGAAATRRRSARQAPRCTSSNSSTQPAKLVLAFFPIAKQYMAENPGKIRLSVRHVAFHDGSEFAVRVLEASRKQDKYWQTLGSTAGVAAPVGTESRGAT